MTLTKRDLTVIKSIYNYKYLLKSQIARLHFKSLQTCSRRLRCLSTYQYIDFFNLPGINETIFCSNKKGLSLIDIDGHPCNNKPKNYLFFRHFAQINWFKIYLEIGSWKNNIELMQFIPEYIKRYSLHAYDFKNNKMIKHIPDAAFILKKQEISSLFFLEIDRGTEGLSNSQKGVMKALNFYLYYFLSDDYKRNNFNEFRVLFVTTSSTRLKNMINILSQIEFQYKIVKSFIWFNLIDQIDEYKIFLNWQSIDGEVYQIK